MAHLPLWLTCHYVEALWIGHNWIMSSVTSQPHRLRFLPIHGRRKLSIDGCPQSPYQSCFISRCGSWKIITHHWTGSSFFHVVQLFCWHPQRFSPLVPNGKTDGFSRFCLNLSNIFGYNSSLWRYLEQELDTVMKTNTN